jgi:hypothetical protein
MVNVLGDVTVSCVLDGKKSERQEQIELAATGDQLLI